MSPQFSIEQVLTTIEQSLQNDARCQDEYMRLVLANGSIHALVEMLGELYLTAEQQVRIEHLVHLHRQCCYLDVPHL